MKLGLMDSLLAYSLLLWLNFKFAFMTADAFEAVLRYSERQGAKYERQRMEEEEDEDEDLPGRVLRVQVIDEVGKKCH